MGPAFVIAALGGIESLLSATVADELTGTRHDSNQELMGQGLANLVVPFAGGFAVTGALARTAANVRSGACTPISSLVHAVALCLFVMVGAPLVSHIPMASLAAVLMGVALRMGDWHHFVQAWTSSRADFGVMMTAFALTVVFDLTLGVSAGLFLAGVLFLKRMESLTVIKRLTPGNDPEFSGGNTIRGKEVPPGVMLFRFDGPLFSPQPTSWRQPCAWISRV